MIIPKKVPYKLRKKLDESFRGNEELKRYYTETYMRSRFDNLLNEVYAHSVKRKDGSRIRHLMKYVAKFYQDKPEELHEICTCGDPLMMQISTSAYHYLTGDFSPIKENDDGGLGAIVTVSAEGLEFSKHQLNFARITGTALKKSKNSGNALQYAETSGSALEESHNSQKALQFSKNSGNSLYKSTNVGFDLFRSDANESQAVLQHSQNSGNALEGSENGGFSLQYSINSGTSLTNSLNTGKSLTNSKNSGRSLLCSKNHHDSLQNSINCDEALFVSKNSDDSLQFSVNSDNTLRNSRNTKFALFKSRNTGAALSHCYNEDFALFASENTEGVLQESPIPNYSENLRNCILKNSNIDYNEISSVVIDELESVGGHELVQIKLVDLIQKETRGAYSNPEFYKEGGTRYLFTVDWGPAKTKRIIKVDKPISALSSPRARRHVTERGCNTANELELVSQIEHPGITRLLDYFTEDIAKQYKLSGAITIEEFFPDSMSLEERVKTKGPLTGDDFTSFIISALETIDEIYSLGFFHRDLKPSNFLIQEKDEILTLKITDWANACKIDKPQEKYQPTSGGHLVTDPLIMGPFIPSPDKARYTTGSEIHALTTTLFYAATGRYVYEYDPDKRTGVVFGTNQNILGTDNLLDLSNHTNAIRSGRKFLPRKIRKNLGKVLERALTIDETKRYPDMDEFLSELLYRTYYPIMAEESFMNRHPRLTAGLFLLLAGSLPLAYMCVNELRATREQEEIRLNDSQENLKETQVEPVEKTN